MAELPKYDAVIEMIAYAPEDVRSLLRAFGGKTGHLIFCSTVDVYARPASTYPVRESEVFRPAAWDYAQKKAECERILWKWYEEEGHPFTVIRPVHTYGEQGAVLHTFGGSTYHLDRLIKGKPIVIHGDGTSLWSAVHRDDAAVAFANAVCNPVSYGKSYHLPGDECVLWSQYHERVAAAIGAPAPQFVRIPTELLYSVDKRAHITAINFQYHNCLDATAAKTDLGYRYRTTIAEGAKQIYDWHVRNGSLENSDNVPQDDRIIAAWQKLSAQMISELEP